MKNCDYLIVGQGLAGTILAWFLEKAGQSVCIIDNAHQGAASKVAAGIINPITGRHFVKSWRFDELLPFAQMTYRQMEYHFDIPFFHKRNIVRILNNNGDENSWLARTIQEEYRPYIEHIQTEDFDSILQPYFSLAEVTGSAQLDIPNLISTFSKYFKSKKNLVQESFDFEALEIFENGIHYKDISASKVVFCEGYRGENNPYFKHLPFRPAKGEVLIVKMTGYETRKVIKNGIFIVPLGNDLFWVGSNMDQNFADDQPTDIQKEYLTRRLKETIKIPFRIVEHKAAVRPATKDRRPLLGVHPDHPQLTIFNGLGTKGASLAPFWAKHFCDHLIDNQPLDQEVDIQRFV